MGLTYTMPDVMPTYRADIDVANDNVRRRKRNIVFAVLAALLLIFTVGYLSLIHI